MVPLRKEITDYSRACEHLIYAAVSADATPFTSDETEMIAYYACEMTNLADQLVRNSRPQIKHKRQTIQAFAAACETLLQMDGFSEEERNSIRHSAQAITTKFLAEQGDPALGRYGDSSQGDSRYQGDGH
jgi:regulator of sirC expression with transglutaminase-like and TPR domain